MYFTKKSANQLVHKGQVMEAIWKVIPQLGLNTDQAHILGHAVMDIVPVAAVPVERLEIESVICHRDIPPIPDKKEYLTYLKENARKECAAKIGLYLYDSGFLVEKEGERLGDLTLRFRLLAARENPEEGIDQETYQRIVDGAMPVWGYRYE